MIKICRFCGQMSEGQPFETWVKPTFTDHDKLLPGNIICIDCLFWFDEISFELAFKANKFWPTVDSAFEANTEKIERWQKKNRTRALPRPDQIGIVQHVTGWYTPQRMRNYSHFIVKGEWIPLSKGDKARMVDLLLGGEFPELAAIAESGQKHIVFRARRNPRGSKAGWVQFEEQSLWVEPDDLRFWLDLVEAMLSIFSKAEIESGDYLPYRILGFGLEQWQAEEAKIKSQRGSLFFDLVLFLAQRKETETSERNTGKGNNPVGHHLAGNRQRVQEPLPADDLGAVREHGQSQRLYQQPRKVRQLSMFEDGSDDSR